GHTRRQISHVERALALKVGSVRTWWWWWEAAFCISVYMAAGCATRRVARQWQAESIPTSVRLFFEDFKSRGITADEIDDDAFLKISLFHRVTKLFGVRDGLLIDGGDDIPTLNAGCVSRRILFHLDHNHPLDHL